MSALKDRLEDLKLKLSKNVDRAFVVGLGVLLGLMVVIYVNERGSVEPPVETPEPVDIQVAIDLEGPASQVFKTVELLGSPDQEFEETPFKSLVEVNRFDPKQVREQKELEEEARTLVTEARRLLESQDLEGAKRKVEGALRLQPNYPPALDVRKEINARESAEKAAGGKAAGGATGG